MQGPAMFEIAMFHGRWGLERYIKKEKGTFIMSGEDWPHLALAVLSGVVRTALSWYPVVLRGTPHHIGVEGLTRHG
jgi:hypothetical protein